MSYKKPLGLFCEIFFTCSMSTMEIVQKGVKCSKLKIKTREKRHCCRAGVFIGNFEHISHLFLVFLLWNLNK